MELDYPATPALNARIDRAATRRAKGDVLGAIHVKQSAATDCFYVDATRFSSTGTWASPRYRPRPAFFPRSGRPGAPRSSSRRHDASANHRLPHAATHHGFLDGRARLADTAASHGLPDNDPAHPRALPGSAA